MSAQTAWTIRCPDLYEVLQAVRRRPGCITGIYRSDLHEQGFLGLETATVRLRLKRLEKLGYVRRARTAYATQIAWTTTDFDSVHATPTHLIPKR